MRTAAQAWTVDGAAQVVLETAAARYMCSLVRIVEVAFVVCELGIGFGMLLRRDR